jgi:RNA polymerase sigma factor (sigma-70 family)
MFDVKTKIEKKGRKRLLRIDENEQNKLMAEIAAKETFAEAEPLFNRLYDSLAYPIWTSLSKKYIPPLSDDDLKDIFQEAWIKILEVRSKYDGKSNVYNWIYIIKRNLILDKIRKLGRRHEQSLDEDYDEGGESSPGMQVAEPDMNIEDQIIESETTLLIKKALDSIEDETEKEIIHRRIVLGQKFEQISNELGIPQTTVFKKVKKTLSYLRPKVEEILYS